MGIKISHPNKSLHNFIVYEILSSQIEKYKSYIRGLVLDLGCGERAYENVIMENTSASRYIGIDWLNSLHNIKADIVADLNFYLPLRDEVADTVICFSVLEHLKNPFLCVKEIYRVLKFGGSLLLGVPFQWCIHEEPYDYFRFTKYGLEYILKSSGFSYIEINPSGGFFTMWFLKFNYFSGRFRFSKLGFFGKILRTFLDRFYIFDQRISPYLDKIDKRWELETAGYFCLAIKDNL